MKNKFKKYNVQFQKISISTQSKVNGNSKWEGGGENTIFFYKVSMMLKVKVEFLEGWEGDEAKKSLLRTWYGLFSGTSQCTCIPFHQYCTAALIEVII